MTEVMKDRSFGRTEKQLVLGFGHHDNQTTETTGETKTVCTLLVQSMVTLGMICLVITATTLLVFSCFVLLFLFWLFVFNMLLLSDL